MENKKNSITTPLLTATTVLLIAANVLLGIILTNQSRNSMKSLINARMLDISNTAAKMLDGDKLEKLTAEDIGTPEYQEQLAVLRAFKNSIGLEYIYGIHADGDNRFSFTIDPDEDDPGEFGEEIKYTDALKQASLGTAAADQEPYTDKWGSFYSAYSPVFDSEGNIAGIVGVDFSASWYEERITEQVIAIAVVCTASTILGILMAFTLSSRIRRRFTVLYEEMSSLAHDFEDLNSLIQKEEGQSKDKTETDEEENERKRRDEITELGKQIRTLQKDLRQYLTFVHSQAFTDTMTGLGNKSAYIKKVGQLGKLIESGEADFTVAVFDMNGLKYVNDNYGHEMGDKFIIGASLAIKRVFGISNIYRIGGDEFIAVLEHCTDEDIKSMQSQLDIVLHELNKSLGLPVKLTISRGAEKFSKDEHKSYDQVFKEADDAMYRCKCDFYEKAGGKANALKLQRNKK